MRIHTHDPEGSTSPSDGEGLRITVVASRFNAPVVEALLAGALEALLERGVSEEDVTVLRVPGAWELPQAAQAVARTGPTDAIVALGCVIRGETAHFDYVAGESARGLQAVALEAGIPIALGLLTTEDEEQAWARAGGAEGNKGRDAALAAVEMAALHRRLG